MRDLSKGISDLGHFRRSQKGAQRQGARGFKVRAQLRTQAAKAEAGVAAEAMPRVLVQLTRLWHLNSTHSDQDHDNALCSGVVLGECVLHQLR
jgi:hypothetical protein